MPRRSGTDTGVSNGDASKPAKVAYKHEDPRKAEPEKVPEPLWKPSLTRQIFIFLLTAWPWYLSKIHYQLPTPAPPLNVLDQPQPSEQLILSHIAALEDIGFRIVGTEEAKRGEQYVIDQVRELEKRCKSDGVLECDVWIQEGSGYHTFNIMDHDVLKVYAGVRNVIMQIRAISPPSGRRHEKDAVLLGSHIDSALPSPGAADDAIGVGVMLDIARVLIDRKQPFENTVLFLWNGAEETFQDGSHLYSIEHETAKSIKTMMNLEAAGTTGGAVVFQATSKEMIDVFSTMPHPRGSVIAADVFASGIMLSDTDFGQFERYLNVSGLDMAVVGHSYFYHTAKDSIEYIEKGTAQHFGDNALAAVDYLTSIRSPLSSDHTWQPPDMVYLTMYDRFFLSWKMDTATAAYLGIGSIATALAMNSIDITVWKPVVVSLLGVPLGIIGGVISAAAVATFMTFLGKPLSWFRHEHFCLILYLPAAFFGNLLVQTLLSKTLSARERTHIEKLHYYSQMVFFSWITLLCQTFHVRSSYLFAVTTIIFISGSLGNIVFRPKPSEKLHLGGTYGVALFMCMFLGVEGFTTILDIFVPLTGRMGREAPAEYIIAVITSVCGFIFFPIFVPMYQHVSRAWQRRILWMLFLATIIISLTFSSARWKVYDAMHPKRTIIQYQHNHTSGIDMAHVAYLDRGPDPGLMDEIYERYGSPSHPLEHTELSKQEADWDVVYPVSSFLQTAKFEITPPASFKWPKPSVKAKELSAEKGLRKLQLTFDFRGLVYPTLAFNAEIVEWPFEYDPPAGDKRRHLKIATSVDSPLVELDIVVKQDKGSKLKMEYTGIDLKQMVPGTASRLGSDMPASKMLLDFDAWAKERWQGSLETLTFGSVTGYLEV